MFLPTRVRNIWQEQSLTNELVTSQHKYLTRRHKDLTSQNNYLLSGSRNMPP